MRGTPQGPTQTSSPSAAGYTPALDGLRGLCLLGVMLFHQPFGWMSGGFLGVSTFFTLSGFLITRLLVEEHEKTGRLALGRFWARRLRRLLPALWLGVAAVLASAPFWLGYAEREALPGDALAAALFTSNFRLMSAEYAYSLLFASASPLQHIWSLAIEAQFYLVYPLLVWAVLRSGAGARGLALVLGALVAASLALGWRLGGEAEASFRLYYGSDARGAELLVGGGLALLGRRLASAKEGAGWRAARGPGAVALVLVLATWGAAEVEASWLYRGGFAVYAVLSAAVVAAALDAGGVVSRLLSPAWLRWIGRVSYGGYVYHWPLFLFLTPERTGLSELPLFALRLAATLVLAGASYRLLEEPIRRRRALQGARFAWATAVAGVGVLSLALVSSPRAPGEWLEGLERSLRPRAELPGSFAVGLYGDSVLVTLAFGLAPWLEARTGARHAGGEAAFGCGLLASGTWQLGERWRRVSCPDPARVWSRRARDEGTELAIVLVGSWETRTWRARRGAPVRALGDPVLDARVLAAARRVVAAFADAGVSVVWLTSPPAHWSLEGSTPEVERAASDPARVRRFNELVREAVASRPDRARVVDFADVVASWPGGLADPALRHDGVHFTREAAAWLTEEGLGEAIVHAFTELRALHPEAPPGGQARDPES